MAQHPAPLTPPPLAPAPAKGVANRQRIVESALHLFMERGYAETSIGDVAEHAGLLKGNLSYYFKTKAEMLESVSEARMQELFGRLQQRLPADPTPLQALEAFVQVTQDSAHELARVGCPVGTLASQLGKTQEAEEAHAIGAHGDEHRRRGSRVNLHPVQRNRHEYARKARDHVVDQDCRAEHQRQRQRMPDQDRKSTRLNSSHT